MPKKTKLTPHQREALVRLADHRGLVSWMELKASGPTLGRLQDMGLVERGSLGGSTAWRVTDAGRVALA